MITPEEKKAFKYLKKYSLSLGIDEVEFSFEYEYNPDTDVDVDFFTSTNGRSYYTLTYSLKPTEQDYFIRVYANFTIVEIDCSK